MKGSYGFKLLTPTCIFLTYLHIFGKRELKPDHEIEKSMWYFNYHFLLLPEPFQFFILYKMVKFVLVGMESIVGKGENNCINRISPFSKAYVFKAYLSQPL